MNESFKMRAKPKQASIRFISVAICFLVVIGNSESVVLCVGQDGHVAIEVANSDCCDQYLNAPAQTSPNPYTNSDHTSASPCGDCIDIPLHGDYFTRQPDSTPKKFSSLKTLPRVTFQLSNSDSVSTYGEYITKRENSTADTLTSIRTTVLII